MENRRILVDSIPNESIRFETMKFFKQKAKTFSEHDFLEALNEIPVASPEDIYKIVNEN